MFCDEKKIDMRDVCPKDVKKMLVQRALEEVGSEWHDNEYQGAMAKAPPGP